MSKYDVTLGGYHELQATQGLIDTLEEAILPQTKLGQSYDWRGLPVADFFRGLRAIRELLGPGKHAFCEVGSGIGSKLFLAAALSFEPFGIELREEYVAISRKLFPKFPVVCLDAFAVSDAYWDFEVVYCYKPCIVAADQDRLNRHITAHMKDGSIFYAPGSYCDWLEPVAHEIWRIP